MLRVLVGLLLLTQIPTAIAIEGTCIDPGALPTFGWGSTRTCTMQTKEYNPPRQEVTRFVDVSIYQDGSTLGPSTGQGLLSAWVVSEHTHPTQGSDGTRNLVFLMEDVGGHRIILTLEQRQYDSYGTPTSVQTVNIWMDGKDQLTAERTMVNSPECFSMLSVTVQGDRHWTILPCPAGEPVVPYVPGLLP